MRKQCAHRFWTFYIFFCFAALANALRQRDDVDLSSCTDFGPCEPCPSDLMDRAECQSTGNRRILQCRGLATWQACGKIVSVERADYYEFMACNFLFAVVGVVIVFWRTRRLEELHYRNIVARIRFVQRRASIPALWRA